MVIRAVGGNVTDKSSFSDVGRRSLLRNGLLAGLGVAVAGAASRGLAGVAQAAPARTSAPASVAAAHLASSPAAADVTFNLQRNWWWCRHCDSLFWSTSGTGGVCTAASSLFGPHVNTGSSNYGVPNGNPSQSGVQNGWRWCNACSDLFWGPGRGSSHCWGNAGSAHNFGSGTIYQMLNGSWTGNLQSNWRWCNSCQSLFWGNGQSASHCAGRPNQSPPPNFFSHTFGSGTNYYLFL
jgi:hypothetical protein